ncbi:DNA ligase D [Rugamonas sp. CCM 8940]|uniref:DNA ligase D n=1 Tax=Rugamonas sp. CCM 8940 TaxID=2765359 RepID=UPI0018F2A232|nr:DNA ligase D [Rugamonas sp. CCM 8940]MBJ7313913.1 DNA ligase D [Rugamonas sp. CCM 8940]
MTDTLTSYRAKRDFSVTPEPAEGGEEGGAVRAFVIQKHWAGRLHYDLRLELDGAMKSWAVPKGPSFDPRDKRMAVQVEDHPIAYNRFEGQIPAGQYGAGKVIIWDKGYWRPLGEPSRDYADGELKFELYGHKLRGRWVLVRMKDGKAWLLIKEKDALARPASEFSVVDEMPDSVSGLAAPECAAPAGGKAAGGPATATLAVARADDGARTAVRAALPATLSPQLATLVEQPPATAQDWLFEIKFDGYRLLARVDGGDIRLFTRNGNDWTGRLETLRAALAAMRLPPGWYDGEIVVHNAEGRPDFGLLQRAFEAPAGDGDGDGDETGDIVYFVFDMPYFDGADLRQLPLWQRRRMLREVLAHGPAARVRFSEEFDAAPGEMMAAACRMGLEGIIGKRRDAAYVSGRTRDWIKLKCGRRQEFVVGGYTDPQGSRSGFGALLLGAYDGDGRLRYVGKVGSGFDAELLDSVKRRLLALAAADCPFAPGQQIERRAHWVRPELVAEVSFAAWTSAGALRHAVFQGLRADLPAAGVVREVPARLADDKRPHKDSKEDVMQRTSSMPVAAGKLPATLKVSNPERVIDQASGTSKIGLVRYYALVGELMLAHLKGRPLSLVRAPSGVGGELFFQKHADNQRLVGVRQLDRRLDPEHPPMLAVADVAGLLAAAQWNAVEFHTQNAYATSYDKPNRIVFDLDPGKGVTWPQVREAALLTRAFLQELGLEPWLKTSGGKGLHLVLPIRPHYDWDTVKAFSQAVVAHMAATIPQRFVLKSGPSNRVGKIYIDYLRNGRGSTTVCAWSARARPGLPISVPLDWDELARVDGGDHWTVATVHQRLDVGNAPWDGYAKGARGLAQAMRRLGFTPPAGQDAE